MTSYTDDMSCVACIPYDDYWELKFGDGHVIFEKYFTQIVETARDYLTKQYPDNDYGARVHMRLQPPIEAIELATRIGKEDRDMNDDHPRSRSQ